MRFLILIICIIKLSNGLTLNCTFENHDTVYYKMYTCIVNNFQTSFKDRKVTEVVGNHRIGMTNDDVKQVFIKHQNVPYLPLNLGEHFPNLESFYVMKSNVQHLMTGDIDGLDKLTIFDVSHNPVDYLGADFFKGHSSIKSISFYDCHMKLVDRGAFDDLQNLKSIYFDLNPCIDLRFDLANFYDRMDDSIAEIYDKCHGMSHSLKTNEAELCNSITNKMDSTRNEFPEETSSNLWSTLLIIFLAFTIVLNIILCIFLIRIYKKNFGGSWHEMKSVLI